MTFHSSGIRVQDQIYQGYLYPYNPIIQYQINYLVQHSLLRLESNIQGVQMWNATIVAEDLSYILVYSDCLEDKNSRN